jgi:hypothetical protein
VPIIASPSQNSRVLNELMEEGVIVRLGHLIGVKLAKDIGFV